MRKLFGHLGKLAKSILKLTLAATSMTLHLLWCLIKGVAWLCKWLSIFTVAVLIALHLASTPAVIPGVQVPKPIVQKKQIFDLIPNTRWSHLRPCGAYVDEEKEFEAARQCVNQNVPLFKKKPIPATALPPRCFVITTDSPNVLEGPDFNGIPIVDIFSGRVGMVLGFYDQYTQSVFIVENVDDPEIYRHELQHHFQHLIGETVNHEGDIWKKCEPPRYEPSDKTRVIHRLLNDDIELHIVGQQQSK